MNEALEMARCARSNWDNLVEKAPLLKQVPLGQIVQQQLDTAIKLIEESITKEMEFATQRERDAVSEQIDRDDALRKLIRNMAWNLYCAASSDHNNPINVEQKAEMMGKCLSLAREFYDMTEESL